jgi:hypothetical protein
VAVLGASGCLHHHCYSSLDEQQNVEAKATSTGFVEIQGIECGTIVMHEVLFNPELFIAQL